MRLRLVRRRILDPRDADTARRRPLADAVNIPRAELPDRTHELPPREQVVTVAGPLELARDTVRWLESVRRRGEVAVTSPSAGVSPGGDEVGRLWEPAAFLENVAAGLAPGRALDLACGTGRDAVFLAAAGWRVVGVDVLPDALARAGDLQRRYAPAAPPIDWRCADLESSRGLGGVLRPDERFDLITVFRFLDRSLLRSASGYLNPGGSLVVETFTTVHRARHGRPSRDDHVLQPGELPALLGPRMEIRHYSEAWRAGPHTARLHAVRAVSGYSR